MYSILKYFLVAKDIIRMNKGTCKWYDICPMKRFLEKGKLEKKWIDDYCKGNYYLCIRRKMEAEGKYHPDNMLPDGTINEQLDI